MTLDEWQSLYAAVQAVILGEADRLDKKQLDIKIYRTGTVVRIDIKAPLT